MWIWMNSACTSEPVLGSIFAERLIDGFMLIYNCKVFHVNFHARMAKECLNEAENIIKELSGPYIMEEREMLPPELEAAKLPHDGDASLVDEGSECDSGASV